MVVVQELFLFKCNYDFIYFLFNIVLNFVFCSGSGIVYSLFTCLGGVIGTYFYYIFVHDHISQEKLPPSSLVLRRLCDILPLPSIACHFGFGLIFLAIAIGLEFAVPWKSDLSNGLLVKGTLNPNEATGHFLGLAAWPPSACGAGVGLLQLLFMFFLEKSLGISSSFTVFAAQICRIKRIGQALPSLSSFTYGLKNYVAILFALGAIGGSALSAGLSKTIPLGAENGTNILSSILGGFILLLGARCAGGCTSGQGISGRIQFFIIDLKQHCSRFSLRYNTSANWFIHNYSINFW